MIVKDLYLDSIRLGESSLAHYIYHLLEEQKISLEENISKIDFEQADHRKVAKMIEENLLGFHEVGIFSLKMNATDYVFIYADSQEQAIRFYTETFRQNPLKCHEYSLDFELVRGNAIISFRDMKKEYVTFPVIAGYFEKVG